jgi:hypothetical protein
LQRAPGFRIIAARSGASPGAPTPENVAGSADGILLAMRIFSASTSIIRATVDRGVRRGACRAIAIAVAIGLAVFIGVASAQVPAPPPAPPPLTHPSVPILPGAPSPLVSVPGVVATPLLTPVAIPTALPTPVPRLFNCSCFTTASGTQWSGTVTASGYATARSAASGACFATLTRTVQSPYIPPAQSPGLGTTTNSGNTGSANTTSGKSSNSVEPPGAGTSNSPAAALQNSPAQTGQTSCNVCACN